MFPSQRGNFFPDHTSTTIVSTQVAKSSSKTLFSVSSSRPKSPPLGISALTRGNERSGGNSNVSPASEDGTNLSMSITIPQGMYPTVRYPVLGSRMANASKQFKSSDTRSSLRTWEKYKPDRSVRQISPVNSPQIMMSRIPSSWSNQVSFDEPKYQFSQHQQGILNIGSTSSNSKSISEGKVGKSDYSLPTKTQQERLLVKKLCEDAMKSRRDVFAFYSKLYEEDMSETNARLSTFEPKNHKGRLCEFMLKLVLERQQLLDDRRGVIPELSILKDNKRRYTPVYCVGGKTILGKPYSSVNFPNSFAPLTKLHDPRNDPKGYRRFCTLVDMKGFKDNEIFLRLTGSCLTVDGVHWRKDESNVRTSGARVMSTYIDLPKGVYPDHLQIGRSAYGELVIQEPWKF